MRLFERKELLRFLNDHDQQEWATRVDQICAERTDANSHGTLPQWMAAWEALPPCPAATLTAAAGHVVVDGLELDKNAQEKLAKTLMEFHPWRKGPFRVFGCEIDTEWRSDWKWDRLAGKVEFRGRKVLDVGCGNSYYGWRMLSSGAEFVLGCEPFLLYVMQFEALRKYATEGLVDRHFVLPITDEELSEDMRLFDLALSMGVLYHRTSPIDHLRKMHSTLKTGGELLLETIIIPGEGQDLLVPEGRYAKMRNVWFLPTLSMLELWLSRTGFIDIQLLDVSITTVEEQRRTPWMTFESLADFLDPADANLTLEGYPAPRRAMLLATAR